MTTATTWPPPGAVKVAWCEPWPLGGDPDSAVVVEHRLTLTDAVRWQRVATGSTLRGCQMLPTMTDDDLLGDFVAVHWAWFVDADGRRVKEET